MLPQGFFTLVEWEPTSGAWLATATDDNQIHVWNATTEQLLKQLRGHTVRITDLSVSADGSTLISSDADGTIIGWQTSDWTVSVEDYVPNNDLLINDATLSPDGTILAVAIESGEMLLIDTTTLNETIRVDVGTFINDVIFTPDSQNILTLGHDKSVTVVT